jgi:hypothetical protein
LDKREFEKNMEKVVYLKNLSKEVAELDFVGVPVRVQGELEEEEQSFEYDLNSSIRSI